MAASVGRTFEVQHIHLGPTGTVYDFNESELPEPGQLGQVFEKDGAFYRLVKFDNGTANVATYDGAVAYWKTKSDYTVTSDASDGEALANGVAGGFMRVVTDAYYCFVQMGGDQVVSVAASTVAGDQMSGHASTDVVLTRTAAGTGCVNKIVAIALSSRGTTTSTYQADSLTNSSTVRWDIGSLL
jgi:hypothetical protein